MSFVRTHHYTVDPADLDELLIRRASLIDAVRAAHPGLTTTHLIRLADGTYTDIWHWKSAEDLHAALAQIRNFAQAPATMSLTKGNTAQNGEVILEH
jgi:hypothetical protein